jgi:hypothetical protein
MDASLLQISNFFRIPEKRRRKETQVKHQENITKKGLILHIHTVMAYSS